MTPVTCFIRGVPYSQHYQGNNWEAPERWTEEIKTQTKGIKPVDGACLMKVTFFLPHDKFPPDFPFGSDLDNLLKRFNDALNQTIFSKAPGGDSCVVELIATKIRVTSTDQAGAQLEIIPLTIEWQEPRQTLLRELTSDEKAKDVDWHGNNAAFTCPLCGNVYIVSQLIDRGERACPECGRSTARINGGEASGGSASIEWKG